MLGLAGLVVTAEAVQSAAAAFRPSGWDWHAGESPNPRLIIAPGSIVLTSSSWRQQAKQAERDRRAHLTSVDMAATFHARVEGSQLGGPDWKPKGNPPRKITGWSAESRANMYRTLSSLDWGPLYELGRVPGMVTLTYPGSWEVVASDGPVVKAHLRAFQLRYRRAWKEPLIAAWKLEFQARGAPHIHLFMAPPHGKSAGRGAAAGLSFTNWLSLTWADIVAHPDAVEYAKHLAAGTAVDFREGLKCKDPRRLAVYFGKHGAYRGKEYQHVVPECWTATGRFWGFWGLRPLTATRDLAPDDYQLARRIMRRYTARVQASDGWHKSVGQVDVWRRKIDPATGEVVYRKRKVTRPVRRMTGKGGFVMLNDAVGVATQLARAIDVCGVRRE